MWPGKALGAGKPSLQTPIRQTPTEPGEALGAQRRGRGARGPGSPAKDLGGNGVAGLKLAFELEDASAGSPLQDGGGEKAWGPCGCPGDGQEQTQPHQSERGQRQRCCNRTSEAST